MSLLKLGHKLTIVDIHIFEAHLGQTLEKDIQFASDAVARALVHVGVPVDVQANLGNNFLIVGVLAGEKREPSDTLEIIELVDDGLRDVGDAHSPSQGAREGGSHSVGEADFGGSHALEDGLGRPELVKDVVGLISVVSHGCW